MENGLDLMLGRGAWLESLLDEDMLCPVSGCGARAAVLFVTGMGEETSVYSLCSDHAAKMGKALRVKCAREGKPFAEYRILK